MVNDIGWVQFFQMILLPPIQSPGSQTPFRFVQEEGLPGWTHSTGVIIPGLGGSPRRAAPVPVHWVTCQTCSRGQKPARQTQLLFPMIEGETLDSPLFLQAPGRWGPDLALREKPCE